MYTVWEIVRDTNDRQFIAVFLDRDLAVMFAEEFIEADTITYDITENESASS